EKVIYFAAHLITWVDVDKRHNDLAELDAEMRAEVADIERDLELLLRKRDEEYETELAEIEQRGGKRPELERAEKARNRDFEEYRGRAQAEKDHLKVVWDTFRKLNTK